MVNSSSKHYPLFIYVQINATGSHCTPKLLCSAGCPIVILFMLIKRIIPGIIVNSKAKYASERNFKNNGLAYFNDVRYLQG